MLHQPSESEKRQALKERIERDFTCRELTGDQIQRSQQLQIKAKELALLIADMTPLSREQSLAFTELEKVTYYADEAMKRNESRQ